MQHHDATSVGNVCSETIGTGDRYWSPKQGARPLVVQINVFILTPPNFYAIIFKKIFLIYINAILALSISHLNCCHDVGLSPPLLALLILLLSHDFSYPLKKRSGVSCKQQERHFLCITDLTSDIISDGIKRYDMRIVQFTEILKRSANAKSEVLLMKKKPHALH